MKKNILVSSTQLEKLSCLDITKSDYDDIFQSIEQNCESLRCLEIDYWKGDYHHFGYKNIKKFKSCKTLHDAFVYAEGLYDGYHAIEK